MKTLTIFLLTLIVAKTSAAQDKTKQFYNKEFNWTIDIPPDFDTVSAEVWAKLKNRGAAAVEKTYNQKIKDETTTIFVLTSGRSNYFEALSQPFDPKKDGSYHKLNKTLDEVIYHTLATQIPGAVLDSATTKSTIGKLNFDAFILKATLPNGIIFSIYSFSRLFGKKDLAVNIFFIDNTKGDIMLDAWKRSTFGP
jgi:hypothetical protein